MAERELLEAIKRDYVQTYSWKICQKLFELYPDEARKHFGSIEGCVKEVMDDAEKWFEKWGPNWVAGIVARVKKA
jgi:hypothetical protein